MATRRWTFRTLPQELRDTRLWRHVDVTALEEHERPRFERMQRAVEAYITTGQLTAISEEQGLAAEEILRSLNRCTALSTDGSIMGWAALLKSERIGRYQRDRNVSINLKHLG